MSTFLITVLNGLALGMLLFIVSMGVSIVLGLMGVLNLAHGAIALVGSYVALEATRADTPFWLAIGIAVASGFSLGLLLAAALRPLLAHGHAAHALLTLGLAFVLADGISAVWGNDFNTVPPPGGLEGSIELAGAKYPVYRLAVIACGLALAAFLVTAFERSRFGAILRAAVQDREMVNVVGINAYRAMALALGVGTALAVLGGLLAAPILGASPGVDNRMLLLALVVVIVGGMGSVRGTIAGAIAVGQVEILGAAYLPELASFTLFALMAAFLVLRPEGLFGYAAQATR